MPSFNYSTSLFIGETTGGVAQPVFFDTHTPIYNNKPPCSLVTGSPGSGKTFFGLTLASQSTILGKTTVILDPKGDFISLMELKDQLGEVSLMNLAAMGAKGRAGLLDPFYMVEDPGEKLSLVLEVIDLFVGGLSDDQATAVSPIIKDVIKSPNPSLSQVVLELRSVRDNKTARNLGSRLDIIAQTAGAKICFAPSGNRKVIKLNRGVTIITLIGMDLPADADEAKNTNQGRLASGILFLVTNFIKRMMHDDTSDSPKELIIDEAWSILASKQGADTIKSVALLGRSKNLSLVLITQSPQHLEHLDIENTISTRFAFRTSNNEALAIAKDMNLPDEVGFEKLLLELHNGECLMQDWMGRYSTVQISAWRKDWQEAFKTNPLDKLRKRQAERAQAQLTASA
jgi:type IV secretory pathway VirB4 component